MIGIFLVFSRGDLGAANSAILFLNTDPNQMPSSGLENIFFSLSSLITCLISFSRVDCLAMIRS